VAHPKFYLFDPGVFRSLRPSGPLDRPQEIEVKNADRIRPDDLRGLRAFGDEYPAARRLLLYRGTERLERDGVLCLPVGPFRTALDPAADLPG